VAEDLDADRLAANIARQAFALSKLLEGDIAVDPIRTLDALLLALAALGDSTREVAAAVRPIDPTAARLLRGAATTSRGAVGLILSANARLRRRTRQSPPTTRFSGG
jgi:hypothetical protein